MARVLLAVEGDDVETFLASLLALLPDVTVQPLRMCRNGHLVTEAQEYVDPNGTRRCRHCARSQHRDWKARKRLTAATA